MHIDWTLSDNEPPELRDDLVIHYMDTYGELRDPEYITRMVLDKDIPELDTETSPLQIIDGQYQDIA